jgi:hypothetical protein
MKSRTTASRCVLPGLLLTLALSSQQALCQQTQTRSPATLRGRVVDADTGEPISKVKVIVVGTEQSALTDASGNFIFDSLEPGELELYITTIGYGLLKKSVLLKQGDDNRLDVALNKEAATQIGEITVKAEPFETAAGTPSEQTLNKSELTALSSVMAGDPVRAAQALPGAVSNDDFTSSFSVRGAGIRRVAIYIDSVLTENLVHTVQEANDTGSISILNGDAVAAISLLGGAFPSKYGDGTAAAFTMETRDGNRVKPSGRLAASTVSLSAVVDGPVENGKGAWLASARKSYLNYVLSQHLDIDNAFIFDFADAQARLTYDASAAHQLGIGLIWGGSHFDRTRFRDRLGLNSIMEGKTDNWIVSGHWSWAPGPRVLIGSRVFAVSNGFANTNREGFILDDGDRRQVGVRADLNLIPAASHRIEAGAYLRSTAADGLNQRFQSPSTPNWRAYDRSADGQSYYAQTSWSPTAPHISLTAGVRADRSELTGETVATPRASLAFAPGESWRIRAAWGQYRQFPDFEHLLGRLGNPDLRAERATHYNASVERLIGARARLLVEAFDREDSNLLFSLSGPRIEAGAVTFRSLPFRNALKGHARGLELTLQRRSANGLTGWLSYSYAATSLEDRATSKRFISDSDQRHTISLYASYRFTETLNVSTQWRYGSGLPMAGFFRQERGQLFLSAERNQVRLPDYSRVDVRANKGFHFKRWKLTLSAEVLNLLARENYRYPGYVSVGPGTLVRGGHEKLLPFLPSAGVAIEF